jgi:KDO2-lipid IV(A) lauroyltransferase
LLFRVVAVPGRIQLVWQHLTAILHGRETVRMTAKGLADGLVYLLVRILICFIQAMRIETCAVVARALAWLATDVLRVRRGVIDENLRHAFPGMTAADRRMLTSRMWEHLVLMVCEIAHAPRKIHRTNWHEFVTFEQRRELVHHLLDKRPAALVSGHFGNFELGGFITGLLGFPTFTVARPLDNPYLDRFVNRFRSAHGQFILPKQGSAAQLQAVLDAGHAVTLLGDQFAGPKGCWVEFFGRPASCHKAIALFTLTSGAPMLVVCARRDGRMHFSVGLEGVADPQVPGPHLASVSALTRWYNERLESAIRRCPEQYWWVHRRWKEAPAKKRALAHRDAA